MAAEVPRPALVELRVLDGANLYFPRPAVKLTLDVTGLLELGEGAATAAAAQLELTTARPGQPMTGLRQRFAARLAERVVRRVAEEAGTHRLTVRSRPTADLHRLVVAYPWRHRDRAEALGHAVAGVIDAIPGTGLDEAVRAGADFVRGADLGPAPTTRRPHVPVIAVTGTNGKTTTARLVARMGERAGLAVGWSSTDGVFVDGELVERSDESGRGGAVRVLDDPRVQLAVAETAPGGILLRGIGFSHNDVAVVTNVSADRLGLHGIDTVDQLAEVKSVITRITRPDGWAVLNGDDPRTFAMRLTASARPFVFTRDPDSPTLRQALTEGGRGVTVLDGHITALTRGADPDLLVAVDDVPVTLSGLSRVNVENALAATAAGLAVGLPRAAVIEGLRSFRPGPVDNPGRLNVYDLRGVTVVVDQALNEAGLAALLEVLDGLRPPGNVVRLVLGSVGDCADNVIRALGERGARGADQVVIGHKEHYLRGRDVDELAGLLREGAAAVGVDDVPDHPTELDALRALLAQSGPGDVVGVMCHAEREDIDAWIRRLGGRVDGPEEIRDKVLKARREL